MYGLFTYFWITSVTTKQSDISVSNHHGLFFSLWFHYFKGIFPVQAPLQKTLFFKANVGQLLCQDSVFERLWTNHDTFAAVYEALDQVPRKRDPRRGRYTPGVIQWLQTLTDVFWWVNFRLLDQFSKATSKSFASARIWLCSIKIGLWLL